MEDAMQYDLTFASLAKSAFIQLQSEGIEEISLQALLLYWEALHAKLAESGIDAQCGFSHLDLLELIKKDGDIFAISNPSSLSGSVSLLPGTDIDEVSRRFYGAIPAEVIAAMNDDSVIDSLFDAVRL